MDAVRIHKHRVRAGGRVGFEVDALFLGDGLQCFARGAQQRCRIV